MRGIALSLGEAEIEIRYAGGINRSAEVLELGSREGIGAIERSGTYYLYRGERLGQGRERAIEALEKQPELRERIVDEILRSAKGPAEPQLAAVG